MSVTGLTQIVRASIAKAKDVALRGEAGAPAHGVAGDAQPVRGAEPPRAIIAETGSARGEQIRATVLQRGGVTATIVAALGGNRYVVNVDGEEAPVVLQSTAIADDRPLLPGAEVRLVPGTRLADALAAQDGLAADDPQWSAIAKLIASATRDEGAIGKPGAPATRGALEPARLASGATPIAAEPGRTAETAASLRQVVDRSGLFYESHLAEWVAGERTLEAIQREPQAQLTREPHAASPDAARVSVAREAAGLVREQIQALQAQQIAWNGPVWRDQQGEIEIGRDPNHAGEAGTQTWRVRLALDLPALGRVEVRLALHGADLGLHIAPANEESRTRIQDAAVTLTGRLEAQGLRPRLATAPGDET